MNLSALAARYARSSPDKSHVALPLLMMAAIYWCSSLPGTPGPDDPALGRLFLWLTPSMQNFLHVPVFAAVAWAWHWALAAWLRAPAARPLVACAVAIAYGVCDEWHQSFVPGRYASLVDVLLDASGAAIGIWCADWAQRRAAASHAQAVARAARQ